MLIPRSDTISMRLGWDKKGSGMMRTLFSTGRERDVNA